MHIGSQLNLTAALEHRVLAIDSRDDDQENFGLPSPSSRRSGSNHNSHVRGRQQITTDRLVTRHQLRWVYADLYGPEYRHNHNCFSSVVRKIFEVLKEVAFILSAFIQFSKTLNFHQRALNLVATSKHYLLKREKNEKQKKTKSKVINWRTTYSDDFQFIGSYHQLSATIASKGSFWSQPRSTAVSTPTVYWLMFLYWFAVTLAGRFNTSFNHYLHQITTCNGAVLLRPWVTHVLTILPYSKSMAFLLVEPWEPIPLN